MYTTPSKLVVAISATDGRPIKNTPVHPIKIPNSFNLVAFSSFKNMTAKTKENNGIAPLTAPAMPDSNKDVPFAKP